MRARESVCSRLGRKVVRKGVKGYIKALQKVAVMLESGFTRSSGLEPDLPVQRFFNG